MKSLCILSIACLSLLVSACNNKPKVIEGETTGTEEAGHAHATSGGDAHQVVLQDFLHTEKYTYMDVTENGNRFWIAAPRMEVEKGATYYYSGGLKKNNFKSQEYDRVFETIYLVSTVSKVPAGEGSSAVDRALAQQHQQGSMTEANTNTSTTNAPPTGAVVKLKDLFANPSAYEGKDIRVHGRCVKINKMIMNRNWVHLDDNSAGGKDLTITTMDDVPVGTTVTMSGKISLNVDFGAGYKYDVIMQDAKVE